MSSNSKFVTTLFAMQCALVTLAQEHVQFRVIKQWKYLNYTWPNAEFFQTATVSGQYIPENIVTTGVEYFDDWFYLTMPRMKTGVPATLGRISSRTERNTAPLIAPFPSWEFNKLGDCNALQNVQNIEIDPRGQMWIIDGGHSGSLTSTPIKSCSPKLVIYDVKYNATIHTYIFSESVAAKNSSFLYDLVIDDEFAYITDNSRDDPGIIVFSRQLNHAWKIRHSKTMHADPSAQHFTVSGVPVSAPMNIAGIAMGPNTQGVSTNIAMKEDKQIFFCPISSLHLYSINTSILRNERNSNRELNYPGEIAHIGVKASQTDGMIMTNQGVLYYGLLSDNSIAKWDSRVPFASGQTVLSKDSSYIQWTNSFTIDLKGNIVVLTNTLQEFLYEKLNPNRTNFWILSAYIGEKSYLYNESSYDYNLMTTDIKNAYINRVLTSAHPYIFDTPVTTAKRCLTEHVSPSAGGNPLVLNLPTMLALVIFCHSYHL